MRNTLTTLCGRGRGCRGGCEGRGGRGASPLADEGGGNGSVWQWRRCGCGGGGVGSGATLAACRCLLPLCLPAWVWLGPARSSHPVGRSLPAPSSVLLLLLVLLLSSSLLSWWWWLLAGTLVPATARCPQPPPLR